MWGSFKAGFAAMLGCITAFYVAGKAYDYIQDTEVSITPKGGNNG